MTRTFKGIVVLAAVMLVSGCLQDEHVPAVDEVSRTLLQTKAVNTSEYAQEGNLLLLLDERLASMLSDGASQDDFDQACRELGVTHVEKVFKMTDDALAKSHRLHRWYKVSFPESKPLEKAAGRFAVLSSVNGIQYNTHLRRHDVGPVHSWEPFTRGYGEFDLPFNDPMLSDQWHYINNADLSVCSTVREGADVGVRNAWKLTAGDPRVIVAICDEGVKYVHPDLAPNMWVNEDEIPGNGIDDDNNGYIDDVHGYNFLNPSDLDKADGLLDITWAKEGDNGHGTHVAGTVAAVNNNGIGVCGVAGGTGNGDGVRLMSCQLFSGSTTATVEARARSYKYAADNGASVLQCSFGVEAGMYDSDEEYEKIYSIERDALQYFMNKPNCDAVGGNFVIYASGNDAKPLAGYPAAYHKYISVSAIGPDFLPTTYTNYGPGCNISAPGGDLSLNQLSTGYRAQILSTVPDELKSFDSAYGYMQGTSMACPHVSGVVALGLSYALKLGKTYDYDEFLGMIYSSVNDLEYFMETSIRYSYGIEFDMSPMRGGMGTGSIDAWRLLMQIEGTPSLLVKKGELWKVSLDEHFGGSAANLTYTSIDIDPVSRELLDVEGEPYVRNGKLFIKCNKTGSAKIRISAIAGGSSVGGGALIGGTEFTKEISILSRDVASIAGGWL
ncbi:MAG: S8 family serine peptidase [Bacteroidales bacterium]|nr:S8 family serine peptidase [Bacteroidales bacterium]